MMGYMKAEQSAHKQANLYDRVKKLLVSYDWSDCSFSVAGKIIKAHKLILAISSPVFEAMFYGPLSSDVDILITDIQPDTFQLILNYIYTDTVEISSVDQAYELLYASRKYMLEHLSELCIAHILANISVDNVVEVLNYPDYMQDKQLITYSLKLFCQHASYLLQEKKSLITYFCLKVFLECDQMNISEKDLIKHVFEWSVYCCKQNNIPDTFDNRRNVLKSNGLFKLLRFMALSIIDLEEIVSDTNNLLLPIEIEAIKQVIKSSNIDEKDTIAAIGLTAVPRNIVKLQWHLCYRSPIRSVAPIIIDANNYIIHSRVKVSKSIFINSLCVPTRMAPATQQFRNKTANVYTEQICVSIERDTPKKELKMTTFKKAVEYDSMFEIQLTEPFFIKKDEWYTISFMWPRNRFLSCSYVVEFRHRQYTGHKVDFDFDDMAFVAGNGGSFLSGLKFCL